MVKSEVHIIIVTYNGMTWLSKCLESCKGYPTIVVDNASTDDTLTLIKQHYKDVVVLPQSKNLGFGAANNVGISYALQQGADYVFLLNQDAYLVDDALHQLIAFQKENPSYGVLSPIHTNAEQDKLDFGFANYINFSIVPSFISDAILKNTLEPSYNVPFVNAAAWLLSKDCLEIVGGFDPLFFHYGEDDNYCQRIKYHGFKIGIVTKAYVVHDREYRKKEKPHPYSRDYHVYKERHLKVKFANINSDEYLNDYINEQRCLKRELIKAIIALNFEKLKSKYIEFKNLKQLKERIIISQTKNRTRGSHYLTV